MNWWMIIDVGLSSNRYLSSGRFTKLFSHSPGNIKVQITIPKK